MPNPANKPIIAVDIDEVLFPMVPDLISYVDTTHSVQLTPEQFSAYSMEDIWPVGTTEGSIVFENYKNQLKTEVAPIKGAAEALSVLSVKYEVIIMTSRDSKLEEATKAWLTRHFPELFGSVHHLGNREDNATWREKAEVCEELGVYCLIDDSLRHVRETSEVGIKALLFGDYAWNQADSLPNGVTRVKDWPAVLEYFAYA